MYTLIALLLIILLLVSKLRGRKLNLKFRGGCLGPSAPAPNVAVGITPLPGFDVENTFPHPYRPWRSGKFVMTMGIQKVDESDWLGLDNRYLEEQQLRRNQLQNHRRAVLQILPGSEAGCIEVLETIVSCLTKRFPNLFFHPDGKLNYIRNELTKLTFRIKEPFQLAPLEIAAQLVMEDLNVLIQGFGDDPEQYYLVASFSMAPAGWYLEERIGWPLYKIHGPVPFWEDKLRKSIEKYFLNMKSENIISRHNFFIQTNDVLFQQEPFTSEIPNSPLKVEDVRLRHERQTLRRLPKTGVILFTVRTYLLPVRDLKDDPESVSELLGAIRAMPKEMADYKGRQLWGSTVEPWCEEILEKAGLSLPVVKSD